MFSFFALSLASFSESLNHLQLLRKLDGWLTAAKALFVIRVLREGASGLATDLGPDEVQRLREDAERAASRARPPVGDGREWWPHRLPFFRAPG